MNLCLLTCEKPSLSLHPRRRLATRAYSGFFTTALYVRDEAGLCAQARIFPFMLNLDQNVDKESAQNRNIVAHVASPPEYR